MEQICTHCGSHDLFAHKKGFSGFDALAGFLISFALTGFIWYCIISSESFQLVDIMSWIPISGIIPFLFLFCGTVRMNEIQITCLDCGMKKPVGPPKEGQLRDLKKIPQENT